MKKVNEIKDTEFKDMLIKDIVTMDYRAASVFGKYGIDFCCKGNRRLQAACDEKGINPEQISQELSGQIMNTNQDENRYDDWDLSYLAQYIVNNHHKYILRVSPEISAHLEKIASVHGKHHVYLYELKEDFARLSSELISHMKKEEQILFPAIARLSEAMGINNYAAFAGNLSVINPIKVMEAEHSGAGELLEKMREITDNYTLPADACTTFAVTYKELIDFERDLYKHVFLENSILFPKAIELEKKLKA